MLVHFDPWVDPLSTILPGTTWWGGGNTFLFLVGKRISGVTVSGPKGAPDLQGMDRNDEVGGYIWTWQKGLFQNMPGVKGATLDKNSDILKILELKLLARSGRPPRILRDTVVHVNLAADLCGGPRGESKPDSSHRVCPGWPSLLLGQPQSRSKHL